MTRTAKNNKNIITVIIGIFFGCLFLLLLILPFLHHCTGSICYNGLEFIVKALFPAIFEQYNKYFDWKSLISAFIIISIILNIVLFAVVLIFENIKWW